MTTLLVCGLPRSGSSLTMSMLDAGGMPTIGRAPGYEDECSEPGRLDASTLAGFDGRALKVLEPYRHSRRLFTKEQVAVILLTRDPKNQAASIDKFTSFLTGLRPADRNGRRRILQSVIDDEARMIRFLKGAGCPVVLLTFEALIAAPGRAAAIIADFTREWAGTNLNAVAMAAKVRARTLGNYPGLLEVELIEEVERKAAVAGSVSA